MMIIGVIEIIAGILVAIKAAGRRLYRYGMALGNHHRPAPAVRLLRCRLARFRTLFGSISFGASEHGFLIIWVARLAI